MSRSGYVDDFDDYWQLIRWRGAVNSAISGKRGQAFFRDLIAALDALPEKKLIANELVAPDGCVCALGALGNARALDFKEVDPEDYERVADLFNIAQALAREVVFVNDEQAIYPETPEQRFDRVRTRAEQQLKAESAS
jgi:hypothetical protein